MQKYFILIILECHSSCLECQGDDKFNCITCSTAETYFMYQNQCLTECPVGTYQDMDSMKCEPCPNTCLTCLSATECTSCLSGNFLVPDEMVCVTFNNCPMGTYPDTSTSICTRCHRTCLTCIGPDDQSCRSCNVTKGYMELTTYVGPCKLLTCSQGSYLNMVSLTCQSCNSKCISCDEKNTCLECKPGYLVSPISNTNKVSCKECPTGYKLSTNGICVGTI